MTLSPGDNLPSQQPAPDTKPLFLTRSLPGSSPACARSKPPFQEDLPLSDAIRFIIKVLSKSMDTSLAPDKVELATVTRDEASGKVGWARSGAACGGRGLER